MNSNNICFNFPIPYILCIVPLLCFVFGFGNQITIITKAYFYCHILDQVTFMININSNNFQFNFIYNAKVLFVCMCVEFCCCCCLNCIINKLYFFFLFTFSSYVWCIESIEEKNYLFHFSFLKK